MDICVIGTGYVGLVTGTCLAYLGHHVICVDKDAQKVAQLEKGKSPVAEPGVDELLGVVMAEGRVTFSTDLAAAVRASEVVFIAVGTPLLPNGETDLQNLETVARSIGAAVADDRIRVVVNKCTVPIGSGNWLDLLLRDASQARIPVATAQGAVREEARPRFVVASNPEFLREGSALADTFYPDRIVVGAQSPDALTKLWALYAPIREQSFEAPAQVPRPVDMGVVPMVATDLASAEMIKYAANSFLATKLSFINEVANLCEKVGADVSQVALGIGLDQRIGRHFLNAGAGWGGSRFDQALSELISIGSEFQCDMEILRSAARVNANQRQRVIQKLQDALKVIKGNTIGILGLTYKPNTDDLRDAPALAIARQLIKMGAKVKVFDPVAMADCQAQNPDLPIRYAESIDALASGCDAMVLMTEWDVFKEMDLVTLRRAMRTPIMLDARNVLTPSDCKQAGLHYVGIGR